ncbi:hypothetical protein NQ314_014328 [Rhamnusium bicolor]|uniref:Peptidase S1 domain-containing protein n=1 Tax=Rhamnusium bicolor TaxID=1586634 RepID=A0AAV8X203_9CUCU|nr:hypothetical protein NQ314_014328 [Rhamnusium bicolor]
MFKVVVCLAFVSVVLADLEERKIPTLDGRIVGGSNTTIDRHPYQISLRYFSEHICGGAIISSTWVLTAAHCVQGATLPSFLTVRIGSSYVGSGGEVITVLSTIIHPNYDERTYDYDIALLSLSSSATSNVIARAIALPSTQTGPNAGQTATITGWGALTQGGVSPSILQVVEVPVVSQNACQVAYQVQGHQISPRMFCAGLLGVGGKDACQGDSGGPVTVNGILYGLVSWGIGCALPDFPGVYSNVANLRQWVFQNSGV